MKATRTLFTLLIASTLAAGAAFAENAAQVVLAPSGALYAVESQRQEYRFGSPLVLTVQDGEEVSSYPVPGTNDGTFHENAALAYDAESGTLYIVWLRMPSITFSEVRLISFRDGQFSDPSSIESGVFHLRFNLEVAVTHWINEEQPDGSFVRKRGLNVHAIWWDQTGDGERGRHAMISIRDGRVDAIQTADLLNFADFSRRNTTPVELPQGYDRRIFRAASVTVAAEQNGIHVVFGDWETNRFQKIEILPIASDGVLSVPLGVWGGEIDAPKISFDLVSSASPAIMAGPTNTRGLALYSLHEDKLHYLVHDANGWSESRSMATSERITADTALTALRNLLAASK